MAAGGSRIRNIRGATTGQGAEVQREGLAPFPPFEVFEPAIDVRPAGAVLSMAVMRRTRVVIVENHALVSESLQLLIDGERDMEVVGKATSVLAATHLAADLSPDVVVMDFHLDDGTGRDATLAMREMYPEARFVFLSRDESDDARLSAVEAGASAYLSKTNPGSVVISTVRKVAGGASLLTPDVIARLVAGGRRRSVVRDSLSAREREVLQLMAEGVGTRDIARRLGISYSTVRTHVRSISAKLGTKSMVNAVVTARELELVN